MALERLLDASSGPLQGLLVLDFGQAAVGPIAAEWLGMLGATVCGFLTKAQTASIGASIKNRSSIFISYPSPVSLTDMAGIKHPAMPRLSDRRENYFAGGFSSTPLMYQFMLRI